MFPDVRIHRVPLSAVALAALAVSLVAPRAASAYCRTTTDHEPIPYNPVSNGCWNQGTPLAWEGGQKVAYSIDSAASSQISLADATRIAKIAFNQWNNATCASGQKPNVQVVDGGPVSAAQASTDCGLVQCDPTVHDPQHVIVFDDAAWPHNDPNNTLALTTVTYGIDSGEIYDADIEINSAQHTLSAQDPPATPGAFSLQAILTHEAGHFFGLAHATSSAPVMYAQYQVTATSLTQDDVDGVCSTYPQPTKSGCACESAPAQANAWAVAACAGLAVGAVVRRRRRNGRA
jgi:MYXO-CTERM domain-containing protein